MKLKPRLLLLTGLWYCRCKGTQSGIGYTPVEAYQDWAHYKWLNQTYD